MDLNADHAFHLVKQVAQAQDDASFEAAAQAALTYLIAQLHRLGDLANGYPRNPIQADVWQQGRMLTLACDQFADACRGPKGEEQISRLAASMAMQIMGHYPNEIFPRVLRHARCREALGQVSEALEGYRCITQDFDVMDLQALCDTTAQLEATDWTILQSTSDALAGVQRLSSDGLSAAEAALQQQLAATLALRT